MRGQIYTIGRIRHRAPASFEHQVPVPRPQVVAQPAFRDVRAFRDLSGGQRCRAVELHGPAVFFHGRRRGRMYAAAPPGRSRTARLRAAFSAGASLDDQILVIKKHMLPQSAIRHSAHLGRLPYRDAARAQQLYRFGIFDHALGTHAARLVVVQSPPPSLYLPKHGYIGEMGAQLVGQCRAVETELTGDLRNVVFEAGAVPACFDGLPVLAVCGGRLSERFTEPDGSRIGVSGIDAVAGKEQIPAVMMQIGGKPAQRHTAQRAYRPARKCRGRIKPFRSAVLGLCLGRGAVLTGVCFRWFLGHIGLLWKECRTGRSGYRLVVFGSLNGRRSAARQGRTMRKRCRPSRKSYSARRP